MGLGNVVWGVGLGRFEGNGAILLTLPLSFPSEMFRYSGDVIVCKVLEASELASERLRFDNATRTFPEFTFNSPDDPLVLGAFGALGNPASFHNVWVRRMRLTLHPFGVNAIRTTMAPDEKIHQLFDRMCIRRPSTEYKGETWHRDICKGLPGLLPSDRIWGGWLNLDDVDQHFTCVLGSSDDDLNGAGGFAAVGAPSDDQVSVIPVPPGHMIVFRQTIRHCITKVKFRQRSYRLFVGFRVTTSDHPLYDVAAILANQSVPPLPSGQAPTMFSANHDSCLLYRQTIPWSDRAINDIFKEDRLIRATGKVVRMVPRIIKCGLFWENGSDFVDLRYLEYDPHEMDIMVPGLNLN